MSAKKEPIPPAPDPGLPPSPPVAPAPPHPPPFLDGAGAGELCSDKGVPSPPALPCGGLTGGVFPAPPVCVVEFPLPPPAPEPPDPFEPVVVTSEAPPPADVMLEKVETEPAEPPIDESGLGVDPPAPPDPTVIGKAVAVPVILLGALG